MATDGGESGASGATGAEPQRRSTRDDALAALRWLLAAGVDTAILDHPVDRLHPPAPAPRPAAALTPRAALVGTAESIARNCTSLAALRDAVMAFDGCALKRTAKSTVFSDGATDAPLMIIGEAPGAEEDRQGLPFVGAAGMLLDRMLAAIGRDRSSAYITNILFWRPPGNRTPTAEEVALCLPFVRRHIALVAPKVVILAGGSAAKTLLETEQGITRLRGRWQSLTVPGIAEGRDFTVPALPTYHPAFLLRRPAQKREAWRDLMAAHDRLSASQTGQNSSC